MKKPISNIIGKITRLYLKIYALFTQKQLFIDSLGNLLLTVDQCGFSLRSPLEEIFFPWASVVSLQNEAMFSVRLKGTLCGRDYSIKRAAFEGSDFFFQPLFSFRGQSVCFDQKKLDPAWFSAIEQAWQEFKKNILESLPKAAAKSAICLEKSALEEGIVALNPKLGWHYPSFCPYCEEDCDKVVSFSLPSGKKQSWFLSRSYWLQGWLWKSASICLPCFAFVALNTYFLWQEPFSWAFLVKQAFLAFFVLLMHAGLCYAQKLKFTIFEQAGNPSLIFVYFANKNYLRSFLALNGFSPFDQLR